MTGDPRLQPPEDRYEGTVTRILGRVAAAATFIVFLALIAFVLIKLLAPR